MAPTNLFRLATRRVLTPQYQRTTIICQRQLISPSATTRSFSGTSAVFYPRKDSQDKDSIDTEATEYSKSGTDDAAARETEAAFDPNTTDPQKEKDIAGQGNEESGNPLDVSPANPEVSKPRGEQEGGAQNSGGSEGKSQSGAGSPKKGKKI